jgi:peptide deformylase
MIRKIVDIKDPILRQKAKRVPKIDKKIKALAEDLLDTLKIQKDPEGVGLAAPQIGKSLRVFAMAAKEGYRIIINPELISINKKTKTKKKKGKSKTIYEGCLSIPNIYGLLKRPQSVTIKFMDLDGKTKIETFEQFSAQIVLHEMDHLNGKLFIDKIIRQKKPLYKYDQKSDEWEEIKLA